MGVLSSKNRTTDDPKLKSANNENNIISDNRQVLIESGLNGNMLKEKLSLPFTFKLDKISTFDEQMNDSKKFGNGESKMQRDVENKVSEQETNNKQNNLINVVSFEEEGKEWKCKECNEIYYNGPGASSHFRHKHKQIQYKKGHIHDYFVISIKSDGISILSPSDDQDLTLRTAWYMDSDIKKMEEIGVKIDTKFSFPRFEFDSNKIENMIEGEFKNIDIEEYQRKIDPKLIGEYKKVKFIKDFDIFESWEECDLVIDRNKLLKPEFSSMIMKLECKYQENIEWDKKYQDIPSKIILKYWVWVNKNNPDGKNITGKWLLYCNKKKVDIKDGLTEIDRNYRILVERYHLTPFKCSTRRPKQKAPKNSSEGVICVYCNESNRDEIIKEIGKLIELKRYMWKSNIDTIKDKYSKDVVKSSEES